MSAPSRGISPPQADREDVKQTEAAGFLAALDPEASTWTFQTFDDNAKRKDSKLVCVRHGTLAQHVAELTRLNSKGAGIFVTVNQTNGKGRKAKDIVRVRAVFVDLDGAPLDPVTRNGRQPHIVIETSPGRWHAYWRVTDVKCDDFAGIQKSLAEMFGGDPSVHDLPRVMRMPGFVHRKGAPFVSRIVTTSEAATYNAADFSKACGKNLDPTVLDAARRHAGKGISDDPADNLSPADLAKIAAALAVVSSDCGYEKWFEIGCAIRRELGDAGLKLFVAWSSRSSNPKHGASAAAAKWPECGKVSRYSAGTIFHHADQADPGWRDQVKVVNDGNTVSAVAAIKPQRGAPPLNVLLKSAAQLQTRTFEPLRWIVPNYLPEGLTVLAGKPKVGKSFCALDIAAAVASGGECLGEQGEQGDVLALFLEDSDRRLQRRLTTMLGVHTMTWPEHLRYATEWPRLPDGGIDLMRQWIAGARKPRLIVVDILERVRPRNKSGQQQSQYSADYEALVELQKLATEFEISILVLHHQRKMAADDYMDTISGTLGLGGAVDTVLVLGKDDTGNFLYGRGRDLEEFEVAVEQDERCRWQVLGPKSEAQVSPEREKIVAALTKAGKPMRVQEITVAVGGKQANVKNLLSKLHSDGEIERVATGLYKRIDPQAALDLEEGII